MSAGVAGAASAGSIFDNSNLLTTKAGASETVEVYSVATPGALTLGIRHFGGNAAIDYRGATVTGADNVLDLNIGLPGEVWRYDLRTKANQDGGSAPYAFADDNGGGDWYGMWRERSGSLLGDPMVDQGAAALSNISFSTVFTGSERQTTIVIPMSMLFSGSLMPGDVITISGLALSTANAWNAGDALFFPDGINHGDPGTYSATTTVVPTPSAALAGMLLLGGMALRRTRRARLA